MWVFLSGELLQKRLGELRRFFWRAEGQTPFLQGEPVDVAVEGGEGVRGELDRKACVAEASNDGVVVSQSRRPGSSP